MKTKLQKEIRLNVDNLQTRADEQEPAKMIIEGYPIIFDKETYIDVGDPDYSWYEKVDRNAFEGADVSDVCLKYNHNDDFLILARTRNESLTLTPDDKGVFIHAELIDTTQNRDIYKMVQSGLLKEGSFAFTVEDWNESEEADGLHRTINKVGKLFDVAICPNGAYGDMTELYARSAELLENTKAHKAEALKRCELLRLRIKTKLKIMEAKK